MDEKKKEMGEGLKGGGALGDFLYKGISINLWGALGPGQLHQEIIANIKTMRLHVHNKVTCRTHVNGRSLRGLSNHAPGHLMAGHFRVTSQ